MQVVEIVDKLTWQGTAQDAESQIMSVGNLPLRDGSGSSDNRFEASHEKGECNALLGHAGPSFSA